MLSFFVRYEDENNNYRKTLKCNTVLFFCNEMSVFCNEVWIGLGMEKEIKTK